jgi:light-regulated signal transduction histidine kinase (bacteriophytochrome)
MIFRSRYGKVVGFCQALQDDYSEALDETARDYIKYAVEGARRMKSLITDLLTYSRVQTQGQPMEPTDASSACDEAIQGLGVAIDNACADVTRSKLPIINADQAQLLRLFQNLIGNAIKYRGEDAPHVQVDAEELQDEWLFRVRDNGPGIDPQYHVRIFMIFQRLHARDLYSGTGIGLAVCKRIVERMGGRIWVESSLGNGSTFCFTVPKYCHSIETSLERCL